MNHSNVSFPSLKDLEIKQRLQTVIFEHRLALLEQMKQCCKLLLHSTPLALEVALHLFDHYWTMGACKNDLILHMVTCFVSIPFVFFNPNMWQILNGLSCSTCFWSVSDFRPRSMSFPWPELHTMHFPILALLHFNPRKSQSLGILAFFLNVFFGGLVALGMSIISQTSGSGAT
jgi:hypothetical protein